MRIGLFGGSFNPPHPAHRAISLFALKRLRLNRVWWLVTPGNPLKDRAVLAPLGERIGAAKASVQHPCIDVTGIEAVLGTRYTADTLRRITQRCPGVRFVWIMGADSLNDFHRWKDWRGIARRIPLAIADRAGFTLAVTASPAARALARWRRPERLASRLSHARPPLWIYMFGVKSPLSSTAIRRKKMQRPRG